MSMAKRQQDLKDPEVRKRIEAFLRVEVGDRTIWMKKERAMAEELKVRTDGEHVVITAEGEAGTCEVRLKLDEVERFEEALDKARKRALREIEARRSHEAMKVSDVEEDFEEAE
jgi:hypothetical protein